MENFGDAREQLCRSIRDLKRERTLTSIRRARQMLGEWMLIHPDDMAGMDSGEELAMMEEALEIIAAEEAPRPEPLVTGRSR